MEVSSSQTCRVVPDSGENNASLTNASLGSHQRQFAAEDFAPILRAHPLDTINSPAHLAQLIDQYFNTASRQAWLDLINNLPDDLPDSVVQRLVVPLLEAADIRGLPEAAENFLRGSGYSQEYIDFLYDPKVRCARAAQGEFVELTGRRSDEINSLDELQEIISPYRLHEDGWWKIPRILECFEISRR